VFRFIILLLIIALVGGALRADDKPAQNGSSLKRPARSKNGTYELKFSGFYQGNATATVSDAAVAMTGELTDASGKVVKLNAASLPISNAFFEGVGIIGGAKVQIQGRLDAAKASRLMAKYNSNNHLGRIVGTLPTDPGDDKWIDDDRGHDGHH